MNHSKHFALWLLRRMVTSIIHMPRRHFSWYKHVYYEFGIFLFYTIVRFIGTFTVMVILCITINAIFTIRSDTVVLAGLVILYCYYIVELITVVVSIQHDTYTKELEHTMHALKHGDNPYGVAAEEDPRSIHARLLAAQQLHQQQW